jgi:hypothetical protein
LKVLETDDERGIWRGRMEEDESMWVGGFGLELEWMNGVRIGRKGDWEG